MAVTKIKPIRGTVNKALAYILDPEKTDDQLYVSSFGCAASDAAAKEFEWTRNLAAQQGMQMPKVIARHLIQSFDIGEVTPEMAHEIGKQFADEWLKGKYEYVIATHIDKGHCHNHIIFNAVNFVDYHAYRSNKRTYREMRQLSDEICKEHGLSVIPPSQSKGMDYKEYTEAKRGTSWKQKLKQTIDRCIITAKDYDEFIQHIVTSHNQKVVGQIQFFYRQLNIFDCSKTSFIGACTIVDHSNLIRPRLLLIVLPVFKMLCELMVRNHHKFVNVGSVHQIIHQPIKDGLLAHFQERLREILGQWIKPCGVTRR